MSEEDKGTDDAAEQEVRSAMAQFIQSLDRLANHDVEPEAAFLLFLMFWENFGPEVVAHTGGDDPIERAEETIAAAGEAEEEELDLCAYEATGALVPTDDDEYIH